MKKLLLVMGILGLGVLALAETPKVPQDIQIRVLQIQKDQILQQSRIQQLESTYQTIQTQVAKDAADILAIKAEAIKSAGLDDSKYDLDVDKLIFVERPAPPAVQPAATPPGK